MIPETRAETLANTESKTEITDTGDCSVLVIVFFFNMPLMRSPFRFHFLPYLAHFKLS